MRKFLILLLLPIVTFLGIGAAAMPTSAIADTSSIVQVSAVSQTSTAVLPMRPTLCPLGDCGMVEQTEEERNESYAKSFYIPVNRWDSMGFHTRLNWFNPVNAANSASGRAITSGLIQTGSGVWGMASDWTRSATTFDVLNGAFGYQVDKLVGVMGNALLANPVIFAAIFVIVVVGALWRALRSRGTRPWGKALQAGIVMALIAVLTTQAAAGTNGDLNGDYKPRAGSPVWIAASLTGAIDQVAGTIVTPIMEGTRNANNSVRNTPEAGWSCDATLESLFDLTTMYTGPTAGAEAVTVVVNSLWAETALPTYAAIQFGNNNPYAESVYCHQLERQTDADASTKLRVVSQATLGSPLHDNATMALAPKSGPLWTVSSDNEVNDRMLIALAACAPTTTTGGTTYTVRTGWTTKTGTEGNGDTWVTPADCAMAFSAKNDEEIKGNGDPFNVGGESEDAHKVTSDARVYNFLEALHGSDGGAVFGGVASAAVYLVGSLVGGAVFGVLGLVVMGAKIVMLIMVAMLFIVLILSLFRRDSFSQSLAGPSQKFLGAAIFAFGSTLLLTVLGTFTLIIATIGGGFFGPGTLGSLMWIAVSPVMAVIAVHFIFTKMLRMPSPVSPRGALAWGTAGGAIGGALGTAATSRLMNRGAGMGSRAMDALGAKTLGKSKATSWMMNRNQREMARGAGDAGTRQGLGQPAMGASEAASAGGAALGTGAAGAAAAAGQLTRAETRSARREARREWRADNPGVSRRAFEGIKGKWSNHNENRMSALRAAAANGQFSDGRGGAGLPDGIGAEAAFLKQGAGNRVSLANASDFDMDNFMAQPGDTVGAIDSRDAASWSDLSSQGKRAATRELARQRSASLRSKADGAGFLGRAALNTQARSIDASQRVRQGAETGFDGAARAVKSTGDYAKRQGAKAASSGVGQAASRASHSAGVIGQKVVSGAKHDTTRKVATAGAVGVGVAVGAAPAMAAGYVGVKAVQTARKAKARRQSRRAHVNNKVQEVARTKAKPAEPTAPRTSDVTDTSPAKE